MMGDDCKHVRHTHTTRGQLVCRNCGTLITAELPVKKRGPIRCRARETQASTSERPKWIASFSYVDVDGITTDIGGARAASRDVAIRGAIAQVRRRRGVGPHKRKWAYDYPVSEEEREEATKELLKLVANMPALPLVPVPPTTEEKLIAIVERELEKAHALAGELREENKGLQVRLDSAWDELTEARNMNCEPTPLSPDGRGGWRSSQTIPYNLNKQEANDLLTQREQVHRAHEVERWIGVLQWNIGVSSTDPETRKLVEDNIRGFASWVLKGPALKCDHTTTTYDDVIEGGTGKQRRCKKCGEPR